MIGRQWLAVFFAVAACSWMPHWACHYYRLETGSSFVVATWDFSRWDSVVSMFAYTLLIGLNIHAVANAAVRFCAALLTGLGHSTIGIIHVVRLYKPFRFEVFGYPWSRGASMREVTIVISFGILALWVAAKTSQVRTR